MLSAPGPGAWLVPAPCRALGLDVGGEGSEHFLGGEVCAVHNQMTPVSEQPVQVEGNIYEKFHACKLIFAILFFKYIHLLFFY